MGCSRDSKNMLRDLLPSVTRIASAAPSVTLADRVNKVRYRTGLELLSLQNHKNKQTYIIHGRNQQFTKFFKITKENNILANTRTKERK